jgi:transcriptional regulator with XRE-family HTH domain
MPDATFAARLREIRAAAGLTQQELADAVGVKREQVARWEGGRGDPTWTRVLALAAALGVTPNDFR